MARRDLPAELLQAFARFGPLWVRHVKACGAGQSVTPTRMRVLAALAHHPDAMIMRQLTELLGTTARAVTSLVDALEDEQLVTRTPHPTDRRATCVGLTARGRAAFEASWGTQAASAAEVFSELPRPDQEALLRAVDALGTALRARESGRGRAHR